ncbi:hypothetical protein HY745_07155, partial [Candidatus Desantisbacteria bacterium]|nr:hypothetical protein [Candidatus Desantisbacteria bacterium]
MREPNPNEIEKLLESVFPFWSISKKNEITRLIYEISKRENIPSHEIIHNQEGKRFSIIKSDLLRKRYPYAFIHEKAPKFYMPKLEIIPENKLKINNNFFCPQEIYIEEGIENNYLISRFKNLFPEAQFSYISSLKNYLKNKSFTIKDYNDRRNKFFIIKEKFDFVKQCPCTPSAIPCGYNIFNLGFGCLFECT